MTDSVPTVLDEQPAKRTSPPQSPVALSSLNSMESRNSSGNRRSAKWSKVKAAMIVSQFSNSFKTLRDMSLEGVIEPASLKKQKVLGEGAFATVEQHLYQPEQGEKFAVAVKRLKPAITSHKAELEAFLQETKLLRKFRHKNIVQFVGVGSFDSATPESVMNSMFLVQEFANGGTLKRLVQNQMLQLPKRLYSYCDALRLALGIANGLKYLHEANPMVIHRDLKLENILLTGTEPSNYVAKLADFGLSALIKPKTESDCKPTTAADAKSRDAMMKEWDAKIRRTTSHSPSSLKLGKSFNVRPAGDGDNRAEMTGRTGSLMYMAPEVFKNSPYNEKVDVFSYGVILYELFQSYMMLCAISIQGTPEEVELYAEKVSEGYRPTMHSWLPQSLRDLIDQCRAQEPGQRPSMAKVVSTLTEIGESGALRELDETLIGNPQCGCVVS